MSAFAHMLLGNLVARSSAESAITNQTEAKDALERIRDEGLNHSQVMETLGYLTDIIGPRLTGSPNLKRANEWTRDRLAGWGLTNAHLEAWGPFGRGWSLKRFSAEVVEPQTIPLIGYPNAWSPGLEQPLLAPVVLFNVKTNTELDQYRGRLRGAIVLSGSVRELKPHFDAQAQRLNETNLLQLANADLPRPQTERGAGRRGVGRGNPPAATTGAGVSTNRARFAGSGPRGANRYLSFLAEEGAALIASPSSQGDGGTYFVAAASVPVPEARGTNTEARTNFIRAWATNAPAFPPQVTLATEDFNRLARMIQHGEKLKMAVDLRVQFHDDDLMAYNTLAEIPGTDLKNQIVMVGAHLDSWHSGTGATDNGAGVAAAMEAVRIIKQLNLRPRRTVRIGLWSGEEQGLLGSKAYVASHFGYYTNVAGNSSPARSPRDENRAADTHAATNAPPARKLIRGREYKRLAAYFNLDNGGGKIRGIYLQGNEAVRPLFRRWFGPFADLGAETLSVSDTGGTDHLSFDAIDLPGFQFIQDPMDYGSRTHHSNEDVLDRISPEDLKQASVILAAFVYNAAMADEKLPRKPAL